MGNRRMMLVGALGVVGVVLCVALVLSAMRAANTPETIVSSENAEAATVDKTAPFEPTPAAAVQEPLADAVAESEAAKDASGSPVVKATENGRRVAKRTVQTPGTMVGDLAQLTVSKEEAREALSSVGADTGAEAVWWLAINDSSLDPEVRKDLIEDLNEDGISDPKHPGKHDLPLIQSRIALIEELSREPMDDVNGEAFAEAYKDLLNMRGRLEGR